MISTTSLLVEHLISGFMAVVWIGTFVFCCYPDLLGLRLTTLENQSFVLLALAVFGYPIGMIIDNLADQLLSPLKNKYKNQEDYLSATKLIHHIDDENILNWFKYNRFKIKIMRACFLNSAISIVVLVGCLLLCTVSFSLPLVLFFILLGVLSFLTWRKEVRVTYKNVEKLRVLIDK